MGTGAAALGVSGAAAVPLAQVHLRHWEYEFPAALLMKYGSPYHKGDAGSALCDEVLASARLACSEDFQLDRTQLICGNEAFPEAAVSDPLADLEVWHEWNTGKHVFPYPGRFSRLGVTQQEDKISSPSSVGVLGEIIGGILAQSYLGPHVLVRCIRHWPDFIFHAGAEVFGFVECNAWTGAEDEPDLGKRVSASLLSEQIVNAVQQLNADLFIEVWCAFTGVVDVPSMTLVVTMVRLSAPEEVRREKPRKIVPTGVTVGLAQRAASEAGAEVVSEYIDALGLRKQRGHENERRVFAIAELRRAAEPAADRLLGEIGPLRYELRARDDVLAEVEAILERTRNTDLGFGKVFFDVVGGNGSNEFRQIREVGNDLILMAKLNEESVHAVEVRGRTKSWQGAAAPLTTVGGHKVWRVGGAAYTIAPAEMVGKQFTI